MNFAVPGPARPQVWRVYGAGGESTYVHQLRRFADDVGRVEAAKEWPEDAGCGLRPPVTRTRTRACYASAAPLAPTAHVCSCAPSPFFPLPSALLAASRLLAAEEADVVATARLLDGVYAAAGAQQRSVPSDTRTVHGVCTQHSMVSRDCWAAPPRPSLFATPSPPLATGLPLRQPTQPVAAVPQPKRLTAAAEAAAATAAGSSSGEQELAM